MPKEIKVFLLSIFAVVSIGAICILLCSRMNSGFPDSDEIVVSKPEAENIYSCDSDADCVLISIGSCCDFTSVNKNYQDQVEFVPMVCAVECEVRAACGDSGCVIKSTRDSY